MRKPVIRRLALAGDWSGAIQIGGQSLTIVIHLKSSSGSLEGTIDIPQQGARGLTLSAMGYGARKLGFDLPVGAATGHFDGTVDGDRISGSFVQGPAVGTFSLQRGLEAHLAPAPSDGSTIRLDTWTGTIYGSLDLPPGAGPFPAALIIAGSGPTDRNGNSPLVAGRNDSLLMIARALRETGIASIRYDKRGIGESAGALRSEEGLTFDTYIQDAVGWLELMKTDSRFTRVGVVGHSEGSLIGMEAARIAGADAYVSLAGAGETASVLLKRQLNAQPAIRDAAFPIIDSLSEGKQVTDVPKDLQSIFRPVIQPYLISWFRYDPRKSLAALGVPVLLVQGTTDNQVSVDDAGALHEAAPGSQLVIVAGMNHILKIAPADPYTNYATYSDPSLPLAPAFVAALKDFLAKRLGGK
jgi:pimeloyl-ACP methyl ester carboxylesterase